MTKAPLTVDKAGPGDAAAVTALVRGAFSLYVARMGREPAPMTDDYAAEIAAENVWAARREGAPEGPLLGALVLHQDAEALWLTTVAVSPDAQGMGVGGALIRFAEDEARRRGFPAIRLYTNAKMTENLTLYPALGYRETERREEKGFSRVFFEKTL